MPAPYAPGDTPLASEINALFSPPGVLVKRTTYQTGLTNAAANLINWEAAVDDWTTAFWAVSTPGLVTIQAAGRYDVSAQAQITAVAATTGNRWLFVTKNSTSLATAFLSAGPGNSSAANATLISGTTEERFAVGDVLRTYISLADAGSFSAQSDFGGTRLALRRTTL